MHKEDFQLSTVICTYNRADILSICLNYITQQDCDPSVFEILIINNNSNDHTEKVVQSFLSTYKGDIIFRYYFEPKQGLSAARNRGIREARGIFINFIDDDALIPKDYISVLAKYANTNAKYAGIGGKIIPKYFNKEPDWMSFYTWGLVSKHDLGNKVKTYTDIGLYPTGCNMTYKKDVLLEAGCFDEQLLRRCDDKYIAYEVKKLGYEILYVPDVWLEHYIDEDRITKRLSSICIDTGLHEKIRLRNENFVIKLLKLSEYFFKMAAAFVLFCYFVIQNQSSKGFILIKMRWWFIQGYMSKSKID